MAAPTTQEMIARLLASGSERDLELAKRMLESPYLAFQPRPDRPDLGDEMTSYLTDNKPGKIVLGGNGSSKSYCSAWLVANMLYTHEPPEPNTPIWIIATTLDQVGKIWTQAMSRFIDKKDILPNGIRWRKSELEPEIVRMKPNPQGNSWNLYFLSSEQGRKALQSASVWMAWCDEQAPPDVIEEVWARLRRWSHPNKFLLSCTPLDPDPWLQDLWDRREEPAIKSLYGFYRLNTLCNDFSDKEGVKAWLESLSPDQRATRQFGDFANFRDACFGTEFTNDLIIGPGDAEYESVKHKIDSMEQFIGVDFGYHHPAALWMAKDGNKYYVIDEVQLHDVMPNELAQVIKRRYDHRHKVYVDYEDIISARTLTAAGVRNSPCAGKNVHHSILLCKDLMWQKKVYVFKSCVQTVRQLRGYRWKLPDENADKEEPDQNKPKVLKIRDHLVDCFRYVIWTTAKRAVSPWPQLQNNSVKLTTSAARLPSILRPTGTQWADPYNRR